MENFIAFIPLTIRNFFTHKFLHKHFSSLFYLRFRFGCWHQVRRHNKQPYYKLIQSYHTHTFLFRLCRGNRPISMEFGCSLEITVHRYFFFSIILCRRNVFASSYSSDAMRCFLQCISNWLFANYFPCQKAQFFYDHTKCILEYLRFNLLP